MLQPQMDEKERHTAHRQADADRDSARGEAETARGDGKQDGHALHGR